MAHDCWFCKFNRVMIVAGFLAMSIVSFLGSIGNLFEGHWKWAGREFLGGLFCLGMIWVGLKVLRGWNWLMDKVIPDGE